MAKSYAKQIKEEAMSKIQEQTSVPTIRNMLSTGSTLLDLACSGTVFGGFMKGKYYFLVGDSASGKTFLSMTCFAEATTNKRFKKYRLIYDNPEDGCLLDLDKLFNEQVADRIEPPRTDKHGNAVYSETVEDFYYHLHDAIETGTPFIYVLDSMDSLDSEASDKKFLQNKKKYRKIQDADNDGEASEPIKGSFGAEKAKVNSAMLRKMMRGIRKTKSILIIVSQTRDLIGSMFGGKSRSGGHALRFYSTLEIWSSIKAVHKKKVKGKDRQIGVKVKLQCKKNRITGRLNTVEVDIFPSYGIDDIGSCVDYLVSEKWWDCAKQTIKAHDLGIEGTKEKLIAEILKQGKTQELKQIVQQCWKEIQDACDLKRPPRYSNPAAGQ